MTIVNSAAPPDALSAVDVSIQGVSKYYGKTRAVGPVSLTVKPGEFVSLLGPSGSGKTTLLMMLAGFEEPTAGTLIMGATDVTNLPPNKRNVGMVFQKYALFPHMTVAENVMYPLKMRNIPLRERAARARSALEMVKLEGMADRRPGQLSGGQQQRVALARAMVFNPPVILMDEPLGALDKKLRQHMQLEIKALQRRLGATVIYVTHDQEEALTMSDRIAVMNDGHLIQIASPKDLYNHPAHPFVAGFIGEMNFIDGIVIDNEEGVIALEAGDGQRVRGMAAPGHRLGSGDSARLGIRPERIAVLPDNAPNCVTGIVEQVIFNGSHVLAAVRLESGIEMRVHFSTADLSLDLSAGDRVSLGWEGSSAHVFRN